MLNALLRIFSLALLIEMLGVSACTFGSTPVGQGTKNNSADKPRTGSAGDSSSTSKKRVSTRQTDARVDEEQDAGRDDQDVRDERDDQGMTEREPAKSDAGAGDRTAGGSSGSGNQSGAAGNNSTDNGQGEKQPMDAGVPTSMTTTPPVAGGGAQMGDAATDAGDPIGNLEDLAKMSPSQRTSATINKFLTTLSEGDAPASSIKEFLNSINDEVNCKMNPLAYECITACQAVGTTCALCILEDECRMTMLDICGVTALGGCIPRR